MNKLFVSSYHVILRAMRDNIAI